MSLSYFYRLSIFSFVALTAAYIGLFANTSASPNIGAVILFQSVPDQEAPLSNFLKKGAQLVEQSEPGTLQWFAAAEKSNFMIIDFFANKSGLEAHFNGPTAKALRDNSPQLVKKGWEQGILPNVQDFEVLQSMIRKETIPVGAVATLITFNAKESQEENLKQFLIDGADIVEKTEPKTLQWYAIRFSQSQFGIFDVFSDSKARDFHFSGKVAKALNQKAKDLVQGGWEKGVVENIQNFDVISNKK